MIYTMQADRICSLFGGLPKLCFWRCLNLSAQKCLNAALIEYHNAWISIWFFFIPLPLKRLLSPSRSSRASYIPVDAPLGTAALNRPKRHTNIIRLNAVNNGSYRIVSLCGLFHLNSFFFSIKKLFSFFISALFQLSLSSALSFSLN